MYIRNVSRNYEIIVDTVKTVYILTILADQQYVSDINVLYLSK